MPKINELISPIRTAEYKRPEVHDYGSRVGSADSWLTNYAPFKWVGGVNNYDYGLLNYEHQADTRYSNQGTANAIGHFAADLGVKTLSGIPAVLGGVSSLAAGLTNSAQVLDPNRHFSDAFNHNVFNDIADTMSTWASETFPTFQQGGFEQMTFLEQLQKPGQLATSMVESIGFMTQSFGIAGLLGKVGAGSRILSQLSKGKTYQQVLGEMSPDKLGKLALTIDERMLNVFLSTNESAVEALDARDSVKERLLTERGEGKNQMTTEQIDEAANNALNNVFWLNMATTSITNGFFTKLVRPILGKTVAKTRANDFALEMLAGKNAILKGKGSDMSGFTKFMLDKGNAPGMVTKSILGQILSEGVLEENLQFSIQKVNDASNINRTFLESTKDYLYNYATEGLTFWEDEDRLKAVGAGALLGGGSAVISNIPYKPLGGGAYKEAIDFKNRRQKALTDLNKSYTDFFNAGIVAREDDVKGKLYTAKDANDITEYLDNRNGVVERLTEEEYNQRAAAYGIDKEGNYTIAGKVKVDENGVPLKDQTRASTFASAVKYQGELDNLLELEATKEKPDPNKIKLYQLSKLADLAQTSFETGTTDILLKKLDSFKNLTEEEAAEYGIEDPSQIEQTVDQWKNHVSRLEANYIQTQDSIIAPVSSDEDLKILAAQKNYAGDIGNRITNLYSLREDIDRQLTVAVNEAPDINKAMEIRLAFETDAANIPTLGDKFSLESAAVSSKIGKLAAQKRDIDSAIEELGATYDKLIDPKNGFKNFKTAITKKDFSPYIPSRASAKQLSLNENSTTKVVDDFLAKRAGIKKQEDRLKIAKSAFFSEVVPQSLIEYSNKTRSEAQDEFEEQEALQREGQAIKELIELVIDNNYILKPEDAQLLTSFLTNFVNEVNSKQEAFKQELETSEATPVDFTGIDDPEAQGQLLENKEIREEDLAVLIDGYQDFKTQFFPEIFMNTQDVIQKINERVGTFNLSKTEESFKADILDEVMQAIERIVNVTGFDGKKIDQTYDDLDAVVKQIKFAKLLQEKAINENSDNELYRSRAEDLSDLIEKLNKIEELVRQNIANKELKNKKEDLHYAEAAIAFKPFIGEGKAKTKKPAAQKELKLSPSDKIIWGHPALGKTTFREQNPDKVLDFDTDFKPKVAEALGLPKDKQNSKGLNEWRNDSNTSEYKDAMRRFWKEAVAEAKKTGKMLVVSDMMFLTENPQDFDKVVTTDKETFIKRATQRGDTAEELESWKANIDKALASVNKNKIISTDKYFSELVDLKVQASTENLDLNVLIDTDPVSASMAIMDLIAENPTATQAIKISLAKELSTLMGQIPILKTAGFGGGILSNDKEARIKASPIRGIMEILRFVESKESSNPKGAPKNIGPLAEFNETYDVVAFKESISKLQIETPSKVIEDLVNLHAKYVIIQQIEEAANSKFNHVDFLNKVKKYNEQNKGIAPIPSSSQIRVVRELATFANSPGIKDAELFQNGAALKAPAGAGKSLVVSKLFKFVTGIQTDEIVTAAPYELAAKNIAESMGSADKTREVNELIKAINSKSIPANTKLIIIDEAGALDYETLNNFASAVAAYNRNSNFAPVKFVLLYDPNQTTSENLGTATIDVSYVPEIPQTEAAYHNQAVTKKADYKKGKVPSNQTKNTALFVENLKQISPLSATYRSSVSEIVDLQNLYKSKQPISNNPSASSVSPKEKMDNIFGTYSERGSSIIEAVKMSMVQNPARSRVIIVGNEQKKAQYEAAIPGVEVVVASKSAGVTRDEVFVDVEIKDNPNFSSTTDSKVYNQWMYTALSRAKLYLHVANATGPTHIVDSKIAPVPPPPSLYDESMARLDEMIERISNITEDVSTEDDIVPPPPPTNTPKPKEPPTSEKEEPKTPPKKPTEEKTKVEDPPVRDEESLGGDVIGEDPRIVPHQANYYQTRTVTKSIFENKDENSAVPPIKAGDTVLVVKDVTVPKGSDPKIRYVVLKEIENGLYQRLTILNDIELDDFQQTFDVKLDSLYPYRLIPGQYDNTFRVDAPLPITSFIQLYIQPTTQKMEYVYGPVYENFQVNPDTLEVEEMPLLDKILKWIYGENPEEYLGNYQQVLDNWKDHVIVTSFKKERDIRAVFPNDPEILSKIEMGVPYLIIRGLKTTSNNTVNAQYVKLSTTILDSNNVNMNPMLEFIENLIKFEKALEASKLPGVYSRLKAGKEVRVNNQPFFPLHAFITKLSDLQTKNGNNLVMTTTESLKSSFPDLVRGDIPQEILELAVKLDRAIHGIPESGSRKYEGDAQMLMEKIGSQNLIVTTPKGYQMILRSATAKNVAGTSTWETSGMQLLGNIKWERNKGMSYNPLIPEKLISRLRTYLLELERRGLQDTTRYSFVKGVLDTQQNRHLAPPTSEQLYDLFVNGKDENGTYSKVSLGFGIRNPLPDAFNYSTTLTVDNVNLSMLQSNLSKVIPDKLVLGTERDMTQKPEETRPEKSPNFNKITIKGQIAKGKITNAQDLIALGIFSDEQIEAFTKEFSAESFQEAVDMYIENINNKAAFTTKTKQIIQTLVKKIGGSELKSAADVWSDLVTSIDVKDTTRINLGGTASRDFIRGSLFVRALGLSNRQDITRIANFVRSNWTNFTDEEYADTMANKVEDFGIDPDDFLASLQSYVDAYNEFLNLYNFGAKVEDVEGFENIRNVIEGIVEASIIFRREVREGRIDVSEGYVPIQIPEVQPIETIEEEPILSTEESVKPIEVSPEDIQRLNSYLDKAKKLFSILEEGSTGKINAFLRKTDNAEFLQELENLLEKGETLQDNLFEVVERFIENNSLERSKRFLTEDFGEPLSDDEVANVVETYTGTTPLNFFRRLLGIRRPSEVYEIVAYNKLVNSEGQNVWGLYKNGVMSFAKLASGGVSSKVVRHELFHKIFWEYLKPSEQIAALNLAKQRYGEMDEVALEEKMAEDWEDFMVKKKPSFFTRLWNKLKRLLGFTYNNMKSLDDFFNLIENNAFSKKLSIPFVERNSLNIIPKFGSYENFSILENIILESFHSLDMQRREAINSKSNQKVLSYEEIIEGTLNRVLEISRNPNAYFPEDTDPAEIQKVKRILDKFLKDKVSIQSIINTYFGNINTRGSIMKFLQEKNLLEKQELEDKISELKAAARNINSDGELTEEERKLFDDLEQAELELLNVDQEDFDVELIDPTAKLTGAIKQKLVTIPYWKDNKKSFADINRAFSIILPKFAGVPTGSLSESLEALLKNFSEFGKKKIGEKPNIRDAVGSFMYRTLTDISNRLNDPALKTNIVFRKDVTNDTLYAIYSIDGRDVSGFTSADVQRDPAAVRVMAKGDKSLDDFLRELANAAKITKADTANSYYLFEDLDFIKSSIAAVGSLRMFKGIGFVESFHYGAYKLYEYAIQMGGGRRAHEATLEASLARYINRRFEEEKQEPNKLFPEELYRVLNAARKGDKVSITKPNGEVVEQTFTKTKAITYFLKLVGVNRNVEGAPVEMVEQAFSRLTKALDALQESYTRKQREDESEEEFLDAKSGQALVDLESGLMYHLSNLINTHYTLGESFSYTRGDGKNAFGWIDASWQTDILTAIEKTVNETGAVTKQFSNFKINSNGELESDDIFLKNNLFTRGGRGKVTNRMKGFKDHDSIKFKGNTKWAKTIRRENTADFRKRHFVGNFIKRLSTTRGTYYQALPIPSNRRTVQNVEVGVLNEKKAKDALFDILSAQKNRPDPASNPALANVETYVKNWKKWRFAGLRGNVDNLSTNEAVKKVLEHIKEKSDAISEAFMIRDGKTPSVRIPDSDLERAARALGITPPRIPNIKSDENMAKYNEQKNEVVKEMFYLFYLNYAVNQYSLSQMLYGDETFYKSKEDQTKRIQIATATGDTNLVDEVHGIPPSSRVLVVEDLKKGISEDLKGQRDSSYKEEFEASDAAGFMLPEFYEKVAASYGTEALTDIVMKPVYFAVKDGIPQAVKYHVLVLTNELCDKFPHFNSYREAMRKNNADQMVFRSAVKVGGPLANAGARISDSDGHIDANSITEKAIMTLDNRYLRFQLNPASDVDGSVKNMSQGTAFINTNGQNTAEAHDIYKANAFIIENGLRDVARELRLTRKGSLTESSQRLLRKKLIRLLDGLPGGRDVYEMLTLKHNNMEASLNLPLIAERVISMISSTISKATTGFRFKGSKLVLEPDLAPVRIYNEKTGQYEVRPLKFKDENGYCEMLLPESYREFVEKNDGIIAFRIPSTNYHSLLPVKCVGFIKPPKGSSGNVVIAPSAIVYYHGSDYDVDSLFVIKKESYDKKESLDLNTILSEIDPTHKNNPDLVIEKGEFMGYRGDKELYFDGKKMHEYLEHYIIELHKKVDTIVSKDLPESTSPKAKKAAYERIKEINAKLDVLSETATIAAKNSIVHAFSKNMRDMKNRADLLTPISFESVVSNKKALQEELSELITVTENVKKEKDRKKFLDELVKAGLIKLNCS